MTPVRLLALVPVPQPSGTDVVPGVPGGTPSWVVIVGYLVAALFGGAGITTIAVKILERRKTAADAERTEVEADELLTRVAVTLVEPIRDRLEQTEKRLQNAENARAADRAEFEREMTALRLRVREALAEADAAATEAHRLRRLVQQWHRAIMDPAATMEWLRSLVGPDEPAI